MASDNQTTQKQPPETETSSTDSEAAAPAETPTAVAADPAETSAPASGDSSLATPATDVALETPDPQAPETAGEIPAETTMEVAEAGSSELDFDQPVGEATAPEAELDSGEVSDASEASAEHADASIEFGVAAASQETDAPEAEAETEAPEEVAQPGPVKLSAAAKLKLIVRTNAKILVASAASLAVGFSGAMYFGSSEDEQPVAVVPKVETPRYVASITRRNEPIGPLVPFDGLKPEIVELGNRLFHDPALSGNGQISCASCHVVAEGGDDGRQLAVGYEAAIGTMNTPTVFNSGFNFVQFWDGRADTLEEQIDGPLLDEREMHSNWPRILKYLKSNKAYEAEFTEHFGGSPTEDRVREALATYERSLVTVNSPFDQWLSGDEKALDSDQYSGYFLFKKLNCLSCHNGPSVGGNTFQRLGKMKAYFGKDNPPTEADYGRYNVTGEERDRFVFRVPQLRNIAQTAPYFHDGSAASLTEAVSVMIEYQVGLEPNPEDVRRIVAFLESLTGEIPTP